MGTKSLLTWKRIGRSDRSETAIRGKGDIGLFRVYPSEGGQYALQSYLNGANHSAPRFGTVEEAKAYAEIEFQDWLKRLALRAD